MAANQAIEYAPQCDDLTVELTIFNINNVMGNFSYPQTALAYKQICKILINCPLAEAFTRTPLVVYRNLFRDFWCTAFAYDPNTPADDSEVRHFKEYKIKFTVKNGKSLLTLDFKTFVESTGLDYNEGTYVSHPSSKAVKARLAKIVENVILLDKTPVLQTAFPVSCSILFTFGNKYPGNKGLPSTFPDQGTSKTKPLSEGPRKDKDLERLKPLADMESQTPPVTDQTFLLTNTGHAQSLLLSNDDLNEESNDDVFKVGDELVEEIQQADEEETKSAKHKEADASYADLKSEIEGFHNVKYKVHRCTEATFSSYEKLLTKFCDQVGKMLKRSLVPSKRFRKLLPQEVCQQQQCLSLRVQQLLGGNFSHTSTKEPPSHTEGEKADMDTKETIVKESVKEQEAEKESASASQLIPITIIKPMAPKADRGKRIATDDTKEPTKKPVPTSIKVRHDPDALILFPYEINIKMYQLTEEQI
nr:hypothetical protein [Tanacetum cinerariifolium]